MSNSEINTNININFTAKGLDETVVKGRSLLLTINAMRLSIRDIQMLAAKPTLENALWTAIQLTRVYTNLRRLIKSVAAEQVAAGLQQTRWNLIAKSNINSGTLSGLASAVGAFALANPLLVGVAVGTVVVGGYIVSKHNQEEADMRDFEEFQREKRRSQGLEQ